MGTAIDGRDRRRLERMCRYMARPPLCAERLERQDDGKVRYSFSAPWKDGTRAVVLAPRPPDRSYPIPARQLALPIEI
ncbi:MAG: transposase [Candidatus Sericytochromatia bacterium]|uniref:Transposase n=1 Tax=Candidatus Tanganyikabacteria bacterium TaxID=2961651 RepID=A0A937X405_9BACT|nr:transposase [Candidatus Tanganyikabacteria bacterium]